MIYVKHEDTYRMVATHQHYMQFLPKVPNYDCYLKFTRAILNELVFMGCHEACIFNESTTMTKYDFSYYLELIKNDMD